VPRMGDLTTIRYGLRYDGGFATKLSRKQLRIQVQCRHRCSPICRRNSSPSKLPMRKGKTAASSNTRFSKSEPGSQAFSTSVFRSSSTRAVLTHTAPTFAPGAQGPCAETILNEIAAFSTPFGPASARIRFMNSHIRRMSAGSTEIDAREKIFSDVGPGRTLKRCQPERQRA